MPKLLDCYFAANPNPEIKQVIQRALPLFLNASLVLRDYSSVGLKGIRRILILVDVLAGVK